MRIPRLSFGKLVHISSSLMTLLLAMNMHALAGHLKDGSTQKTPQPAVTEAAAEDGETHEDAPPADTASILPPQHVSTKADRNAIEGWIPLLQSDDAGGGDAQTQPQSSAARQGATDGDCPKGLSCASMQSSAGKFGGDFDPEVSKAEADLVKDILARRSDIDSEQKNMAEQKHVLDAAKTALNEKMHDLDASMALLAEKQAAHRENVLAETDRLVKIYEDMPPKEAAAVFNIMDIHVLVSIASQMNPRKIAAIMGSMTPERVNLVSQFLAGVRSFRPIRVSAVSDGRTDQGTEGGTVSYTASVQQQPAQGPLTPSRQ
ncbi:hypothetical protein JCM25156A_31690 [Komagataeibacter kakiaceti JCM 25156]